MRSVVVGLALTLGVVGGVQADTLAGDYSSRTATSQLSAVISATPSGGHTGRVLRTSERCIADMQGPALATPTGFTVTQGQCVITAKRKASGFDLTESEGCSGLHGASCTFGGSVKRAP